MTYSYYPEKISPTVRIFRIAGKFIKFSLIMLISFGIGVVIVLAAIDMTAKIYTGNM